MASSLTMQTVVQVSGRTFTYSHTFSNESSEIQEFSVADGQTDKQVTLSVDVSGTTFFLIVSTAAVTFETNNGATPDDSISLVANKPYIWSSDSYDSFQIATDVTTDVFFTNASGSEASVTIIKLTDVTP